MKIEKEKLEQAFKEMEGEGKKYDRREIYQKGGLYLGVVVYEDKRGEKKRAIVIRTGNPRNSVAITGEDIGDLQEIVDILTENEDIFKELVKRDSKTKTVNVFK